MSHCFHHLPGAAEARTHHLVDLACNGLAAAAADVAEVVGIAFDHFHIWHWYTPEVEALRVDTYRLSGDYTTSLSAAEPVVVVHRIRKLASTVEEVQRMVIAFACCLATVLLETGCLVSQASTLGRLHWTVAWPVAEEASFAGTAGMTEVELSLGEMEQEAGA